MSFAPEWSPSFTNSAKANTASRPLLTAPAASYLATAKILELSPPAVRLRKYWLALCSAGLLSRAQLTRPCHCAISREAASSGGSFHTRSWFQRLKCGMFLPKFSSKSAKPVHLSAVPANGPMPCSWP